LCCCCWQDDDDDGEGDDEQRPWHKRPKVWLHIVAFGLSACLLLVGVGSQFVPWMNVVSGPQEKRGHATKYCWLV
jgi:hypothetical protein